MKRVNMKKLYDDFADLGWDYTAGRMSRSAMECYDTVSYTHLRAHETPEHLV